MQSLPLLASLKGPLWPGVVAPYRVLSMRQTEVNCALRLNWIVWNRTALTFNWSSIWPAEWSYGASWPSVYHSKSQNSDTSSYLQESRPIGINFEKCLFRRDAVVIVFSHNWQAENVEKQNKKLLIITCMYFLEIRYVFNKISNTNKVTEFWNRTPRTETEF